MKMTKIQESLHTKYFDNDIYFYFVVCSLRFINNCIYCTNCCLKCKLQKQEKKKNQLFAATRSMLNEISAMPPLNQMSVKNMAAITQIVRVKTFQFNNPTY
eukprot:268808_1